MRLAIGVFDGVHRGHQKVIAKAHLALVITPHPDPSTQLLTTAAEKKDLIGNIAEFAFSPRRARLSPEAFLKLIWKKYKPETIIVGHDFHFGCQRSGNVATLKKLGCRYKLNIEEIPEYYYRRERVRSSIIRDYLRAGQIRRANSLLGRDYQLYGAIVRGKQLGRKLGYPTLNIRIDEPRKLIPADGVYSGEVIVQNKIYRAGIFIGNNLIEAHLLNFAGQIYGQKAVLFPQDYLRPPQKFQTLAALRRQIKKDIQKIKR